MASENFTTEHSMVAELGEGWKSIHHCCNVHVVARLHKRTFFCLEDIVGGMINFSLLFGVGSGMLQLRQAIAAVVLERLHIIKGYPSEEVLAYQDFILSLFMDTGASLDVRTYTLRHLVNGDWRKQDIVED
eukprot:725702-Amphidinium_carterae.3